MTDNYYLRQMNFDKNGNAKFATFGDKKNQGEVAKVIEARWGWKLFPYGSLCPVDYFALDAKGLIVGAVEIKTRRFQSSDHPDVYLNFRKWVALALHQLGAGVPSLFVVKFADCIKYTTWNKIDPRTLTLGGCMKRVKSHTDIEPVILVPICDMEVL